MREKFRKVFLYITFRPFHYRTTHIFKKSKLKIVFSEQKELYVNSFIKIKFDFFTLLFGVYEGFIFKLFIIFVNFL